MRGAANSGGAPRARRYADWLRTRLTGLQQPSATTQAISRTERILSLALLALAVAFNLYFLRAEVLVSVPSVNDSTLHQIVLRQTQEAFSQGWDPTDFWLRPVAMGYAFFHYYQHLGYLVPALFDRLLPGSIAAHPLLNWTNYLLLASFPVSIYVSMRRLGFHFIACGCASLVAPLISTNGLYGLELNSYVWLGFGLYTQAWGMVLLPLALAFSFTATRDGRGYFPAVALVAATFVAHVIYGYIAIASMILFIVLAPNRRHVLQRGRRIFLLLAFTGIVISYFVVPLLLDSAYLNHSSLDPAYKYDSFGASSVMRRLVSGELFDYGRFPSLTILLAIGGAFSLWKWREERHRLVAGLFVLWLLVYFGRPTWGFLIDLQPLGNDIYFHRMIGGVQLAGILLIGIALSLPWRWALARKPVYLLAPAVLTIAVLSPVFAERIDYLGSNQTFMERNHDTYEPEKADISRLIATIQSRGPGRTYAGLYANWGREYNVATNVNMYTALAASGIDMLGRDYFALSFNGDAMLNFDETRQDQYDIFNVRYVVAPPSHRFPDFVKPIGDFGQNRLYEVDSGGYFDLVGSDVGFSGDKSDLYPATTTWLRSSLPGAGEYPAVSVTGDKAGSGPQYPLTSAPAIIPGLSFEGGASRGKIVSQTAGDDAFSAVVTVDRDSYLLLKATYHPNWHAYVDGQQVDTTMLLPSYEGVHLSPGSHLVRFEYRSQGIRHVLGILGLFTLVGLGFLEWRREQLVAYLRRRGLKLPVAEVEKPTPAELPTAWPAMKRRKGKKADPLEGLRQRTHGVWAAIRSRLSAITSAETVSVTRPFAADRPSAPQEPLLTRLRAHWPYLLALAVAVVLAGLPLLSLDAMGGHDSREYLPRNVEFWEGLKAGQIFPRWAPDLASGYGEPTFNYNPPVYYYLSSFFHLVGFGFVASEDLAAFTLLALAGAGMYALAQSFFGREGGLVAAIAYVFAPFLLSRLYVSHAMADYTALAFIPWALWGLYAFVMEGRYPFLLIGSLSVALIFLSSSSIALFTFPVLVLLAAAIAWRERSRKAVLRGAWYLLLAAGLAAFYVLPALLETSFVHLERRKEFVDFHDQFVYLHQFFYGPWGYGLSVAGDGDGMSFALGFAHLAAVAVSLAALPHLWRTARRAATVVIAALAVLLIGMFFSTRLSLPIWDAVSTLQPLNHPWRFLALAAVSTSFLFGVPFLLLPRARPAARYALMAGAIGAILVLNLPHAHPPDHLDLKESDYSPANIVANGIAASVREFEPIDVTQFPGNAEGQKLVFLSGQASVATSKVEPYSYRFGVSVDTPARARVNTFYFPGWQLYVDGQRREILHDKPQGLMEFSLAPGFHVVDVRWGSTEARTWGWWLSVLALLFLVATPWLGSRGPALLRRVTDHRNHDRPTDPRPRRAPPP